MDGNKAAVRIKKKILKNRFKKYRKTFAGKGHGNKLKGENYVLCFSIENKKRREPARQHCRVKYVTDCH